MPSTKINVRRKWTPELKRSIIECVHSALVGALKIPDEDSVLRLVEHAPEDFAVPPSATEYFTLIEVDLFSGRSLSAKKALYQAIVGNLSSLGIPPTEIKVLLRESPVENWGLRGGVPASEVDLGFKVNI